MSKRYNNKTNSMNINPVVSIIVITYNRKLLLIEAIKSILNQTYQNFEVIVVDNSSDYDFFGLLQSFGDERISGYQIQNHGVIACSRNLGIEKAKGKYLAFCDDDDLWMPTKLEKQIGILESGKYDFVSTSIIQFYDGTSETRFVRQVYKTKFEPFLLNKITPSTVIVLNKRDVRFDEDPFYNASEDIACWLKLLLLNYRLYQIEEPLVLYRVFQHNLSKYNRNPHSKLIKINKNLYKKYRKTYPSNFYILAITFHWFMFMMIKTRTFYLIRNIKRCILVNRSKL